MAEQKRRGRPPTPLPREVILSVLRETGSWTAAAKAAGVLTITIRRACARDPEFGAQCDEARDAGQERVSRLSVATEIHETYPRFEGSVVRHGTHSGWTRHQRHGEQPCDPCWRAKHDYDQRRLTDPVKLQRGRLRARAQGLAESELVRRHKAEYDELYAATLAELFGAVVTDNEAAV